MNDLISRQAAMNAFAERVKRSNNSDFAPVPRWNDAVEIVENLPSVQPQRWIPVTERLPEDGVTVWVTIKGHDVIRCEDGETLEQAVARISKIRWVTQGYWSEEEHGWNDPSFGCPLIVKPVAWMPMEVPEPYKEGQE